MTFEMGSFERTVLTTGTRALEGAMHKVFCEVYEASIAEDDEIPDLTTVLNTRDKGQMVKSLTDNGASDDAAWALVNTALELATVTNVMSGIFAPDEFGLAQGAFMQGDDKLPGIAYSLEFGEDDDPWVAVETSATVISEAGVFDDEALAAIKLALGDPGTGIRSISSRVPQETLDLAQELLDLLQTANTRNLYEHSVDGATPFMGVEMLVISGKCLVKITGRFIFDPKDVKIITSIPTTANPRGYH